MLPLTRSASRFAALRLHRIASSKKCIDRAAWSTNHDGEYGTGLSYMPRQQIQRFSASHTAGNNDLQATVKRYKQTLSFPAATCSLQDLAVDSSAWIDQEVVMHGYLGSRRDASKTLTFAELSDASLKHIIQLVSNVNAADASTSSPRELVRSLRDHVPVAIRGVVKSRNVPIKRSARTGLIESVEIALREVIPLNSFDDQIIMKAETVFPPEQRHLQLRNDQTLRDAIAFRSRATRLIRDELCGQQQFLDIETPLLFKSTPEGAREFLVPTRNRGLAYALPQSPQQYKQILMASGVQRYMQIARCFRDEDLRADRQPEFTQVDVEMSFASAEDVMSAMEKLIVRLWQDLLGLDMKSPFSRMRYQDAMVSYGSDKPDLRFKSKISRVEDILPRDLIGKIGPLQDPAVEAFKLSLTQRASDSKKFIAQFMDSPEAQPFQDNESGQPGIFIIDSKRPLDGLHPFGFEAADKIKELLDLEDGDVLVIQARPNQPFSGGSTPIGNLRLALHKAAISQGLIDKPDGFAFTWIVDFPLFTASSESEPGQGGKAGLSSTHHPFTSPKTAEDVDLLLTEPLKVTADHYDLVVNGVELGGGSRRIHDAAMQELIMREVLQMSDERIGDFAHLLEVLRAGCPPHAGIALGLDRLIAVMLGRESVRDVIAFPKSGRGEDMLVKSPTLLTQKQLDTYHLCLSKT